ncbi:MAG: serine hydrolase [Longimicrobiales bacterium]
MTGRGALQGVLAWIFLAGLAFQGWGCGPDAGPDRRIPRSPGLKEADRLVAEAVGDGLVPGAVLRVSRDGEVVLERAYGSAQAMVWEGTGPGPRRLDPPRPMTGETAFDLASVTKVMATTMAVMLLVDRGQVSVDEPVGRYLPAFSGPEKRCITLRHLLTHTSGLAQWQPLYYQASTAGEALAAVAGMPLHWRVGEERHYSDLGFMVLGYLVAEISGRPLDRFVEEEIYRPLGLARTGFEAPAGPFAATSHGNPFEGRMVHDTAFGYRYEGDAEAWRGWRRYTLVGEVNDGNAFHAHGGVAGHAGLFSTAGELDLLLRLLLRGGSLPGTGGRDDEQGAGIRLFSSETVDTFLTESIPGQALGWQSPSWAPAGNFSHTGFTGTFVMGIPAPDLAVVLLTNRQNFGVDAETRYPDLSTLQREVVQALLADG